MVLALAGHFRAIPRAVPDPKRPRLDFRQRVVAGSRSELQPANNLSPTAVQISSCWS
jgi:hypothetical protein